MSKTWKNNQNIQKMSGHVGDLSPKQEEILNKFREKVKDVLKPDEGDYFLLRWLRAREFDLKKAESMLRDAVSWRRQIGADNIVEDYKFIEVLEKYRTGGIIGMDKTGCPVFIDPYGLIDMKGVEMYLRIVEVCESRYPESLKHVFVINAPKIFPVMWHIVKPFLHEATVKKVKVLSGNYQSALLKVIDAECLPACYGGTMVDENGDPRCSALICQGGIVPKSYYCQAMPAVSMTTSTVGRGSTLQLEYDIKLPNSILRWQYLTEDHDIAFGVFLKTTEGQQKTSTMKELITSQRSNSQLVPEEGMLECTELGTYVVRFDNTYSWARSKKVHYLIEVLEPEKDAAIEDEDDEFFEAKESTNM